MVVSVAFVNHVLASGCKIRNLNNSKEMIKYGKIIKNIVQNVKDLLKKPLSHYLIPYYLAWFLVAISIKMDVNNKSYMIALLSI